jgi:hypothetical protein
MVAMLLTAYVTRCSASLQELLHAATCANPAVLSHCTTCTRMKQCIFRSSRQSCTAMQYATSLLVYV